MSANPPDSSSHTYYLLGNQHKTVIILLGLVAAASAILVSMILSFGVFSEQGNVPIACMSYATIYILMCGAMGLWGGYTLSQMRLVISPAGLEYHMPNNLHCCTTWDNLARIESRPWPGRDMLVLRQPVPRQGPWWGSLSQQRRIQLPYFGASWRSTPLADDLKRYAPHLFNQ